MKALIRPAVRGLVNALDAGIGNKSIQEISSRIPVPNKKVAREVALQSRKATKSLTGANKFEIEGKPMLAKVADAKTDRIKIQPDDPKTGTKARSDSKRTLRATPKGEDEAAAINKMKAKAAKRNRDLLHTATYGDRKSIVEHDVALRAGGDNERLSISDPDFKDFKDAIEQKVYNKFGEKGKYIVTIDDVSGGVRILKRNTYDKYKKPSDQKGITIEPGEDIDKALKTLK